MRILVSFLFIFLIGAVDAQLNCKTFKGKFGDSIVCFHSGVEISPQKHMEQTVYEKESVQFVLKNLTGRKLNIYLISKKDPNDRRIIVLRKNKEYTIGYVERESKKFGIFDQYQIEVLPIGKSIKTLFITDDQIKTREKEVTLIIRVDQ